MNVKDENVGCTKRERESNLCIIQAKINERTYWKPVGWGGAKFSGNFQFHQMS